MLFDDRLNVVTRITRNGTTQKNTYQRNVEKVTRNEFDFMAEFHVNEGNFMEMSCNTIPTFGSFLFFKITGHYFKYMK